MECRALKQVRKSYRIGILAIKRIGGKGKIPPFGCMCEGCQSGNPRIIDKDAHRKFVENIFSMVN